MYIIKVSDLAQRVSEMVEDGMDYVEVIFFEEDGDCPAAVGFSAASAKHLNEWVDYDSIDTESIDA